MATLGLAIKDNLKEKKDSILREDLSHSFSSEESEINDNQFQTESEAIHRLIKDMKKDKQLLELICNGGITKS